MLRSLLLPAALTALMMSSSFLGAQNSGGQEPAIAEPVPSGPGAPVPGASTPGAPVPGASTPGAPVPGASTPGVPELAKRFLEWLQEVDPLITLEERLAFLRLGKDYQRDAFIRRFWQVRDPYPKTGRNELRERWEERMNVVRGELGGVNDDRSRIYLVHGSPDRAIEIRCTTSRKPAEIWAYNGSDVVDFRFVLIFVRARGGLGPARLWRPQSGAVLENILQTARSCINGHLLGGVIASIRRAQGDYAITLDRILSKPKPRSEEWVATFASYSTDLPDKAGLFDAAMVVDHPGRYQSRTVTQAVVQVPSAKAGISEFAGFRSYNFLLTGEIILKDQLFDAFRYKFGFPVEDLPTPTTIPLAFQRYLRPGDYTFVIKVEDLNSRQFFRQAQALSVPRLENVVELPPPTDPETARLFAEATASLDSGTAGIRIVPPAHELVTGYTRFDTLAAGDEIDSVAFFLDEKLVLTKTNPPFNVELDLGPFPHLRSLRVEAQDDGGQVVAEDELLLNVGGQRFKVRLLEPRRNKVYTRSLRARAEVEVPERGTVERVEFYLNEALIATLYQAPFVQPIPLPGQKTISYVRAVAYLTDENSTEDLVFINAPDHLEEIEVQFVELYAAAVDRGGRPIGDLAQTDFRVEEDGVKQQIARFDRVEDLPIHVGILIDNSASMRGSLDQTRQAALSFFQQAIKPRDRAAVITFNRYPYVAVTLTSNLASLGGGLAGLTAEGQTALYDSLMFTLYYFAGTRGQRAILLLSDGKDEVSRYSFEDTLEYARRAGVIVYSIGLKITEGGARRKLSHIAEETGGQSYFIQDVVELEGIYEAIQKELRSQYLIAYQSTNTDRDTKFRAVEVDVARPGVTVKTMSGYYP